MTRHETELRTRLDMDDFKRRFLDGNGRITVLPSKQRMKRAMAAFVASHFECGHVYSEIEVNHIIAPLYDDYVEIRRMVVDYGYLERDSSGSSYQLIAPKE